MCAYVLRYIIGTNILVKQLSKNLFTVVFYDGFFVVVVVVLICRWLFFGDCSVLIQEQHAYLRAGKSKVVRLITRLNIESFPVRNLVKLPAVGQCASLCWEWE